ncbi:hypothetical protein P7K49_029925, partial [Saguinus oedipus]
MEVTCMRAPQEFEASEDTSGRVTGVHQFLFGNSGAFVRVLMDGWSILGEGMVNG